MQLTVGLRYVKIEKEIFDHLNTHHLTVLYVKLLKWGVNVPL